MYSKKLPKLRGKKNLKILDFLEKNGLGIFSKVAMEMAGTKFY